MEFIWRNEFLERVVRTALGIILPVAAASVIGFVVESIRSHLFHQLRRRRGDGEQRLIRPFAQLLLLLTGDDWRSKPTRVVVHFVTRIAVIGIVVIELDVLIVHDTAVKHRVDYLDVTELIFVRRSRRLDGRLVLSLLWRRRICGG